jgi:hypothetical protein
MKTSALDASEWLPSRPDRFTWKGEAGWAQSWSLRCALEKNLCPYRESDRGRPAIQTELSRNNNNNNNNI